MVDESTTSPADESTAPPADELPTDPVNAASLFTPQKSVTPETQLLDVINGVMSTSDMAVRTVLDDKHIVAITVGLIFADAYKSDRMKLLIQTLMEIRVSKGGRGRTDLISAIKSSLAHFDREGDEQKHGERSRKRRLWG